MDYVGITFSQTRPALTLQLKPAQSDSYPPLHCPTWGWCYWRSRCRRPWRSAWGPTAAGPAAPGRSTAPSAPATGPRPARCPGLTLQGDRVGLLLGTFGTFILAHGYTRVIVRVVVVVARSYTNQLARSLLENIFRTLIWLFFGRLKKTRKISFDNLKNITKICNIWTGLALTTCIAGWF